MYVNSRWVTMALGQLRATVHPFFAVSYLVLKRRDLPVGEAVPLPVAELETEFLDQHYRIDPSSNYYVRAWTTGSDRQDWVQRPKYASSTLQRIRVNTFGDAFLHEKYTDIWAWRPDYIDVLARVIDQQGLPRLPALWLSIWLNRDTHLPPDTSSADLVYTLRNDYNISELEFSRLFAAPSAEIGPERLLDTAATSWPELRRMVGPPPDAAPQEGGLLSHLRLQGVGPAHEMEFFPGERLNIITGDNGLGKTFLLECAWWALSGSWAGRPAHPQSDTPTEPEIAFAVAAEDSTSHSAAAWYHFDTQAWDTVDEDRPVIPGLVLYARAAGGFGVWDPVRHYWLSLLRPARGPNPPILFTPDQVWDGIHLDDGASERFICNGLIRDWVMWQERSSEPWFQLLSRVLLRLSPPSGGDIGPLRPGPSVRLPRDSRYIPTIRHPYADVPVLHTSAGIRRVLSLAYLIVWAWSEHVALCNELDRRPERRIVLMVDELEAHLHPHWQRSILPALVGLAEDLSTDLAIQFLIATHSPLVAASVEPLWAEQRDRMFHLDIESGRDVVLRDMEFTPHGTADLWLVSDAFELKQPRSQAGEFWTEQAMAIQLADEPDNDRVREIHEHLQQVLSPRDEFWPRWLFFAEQHGVEA